MIKRLPLADSAEVVKSPLETKIQPTGYRSTHPVRAILSNVMVPSSDLLLNYDSYRAEHDQFQWDVHILIEGTLNASIQYLNSEARA